MTTIETLCPHCGPVETTPDRIVLRLSSDSASFRFRCPECRARVRRTAGDAAVLVLVRAGVRPRGLARVRWGRPSANAAQDWHAGRPKEPALLDFSGASDRAAPEAVAPMTGATGLTSPITWDEVVEFALLLGEESTASTPPPARVHHRLTRRRMAGHTTG